MKALGGFGRPVFSSDAVTQPIGEFEHGSSCNSKESHEFTVAIASKSFGNVPSDRAGRNANLMAESEVSSSRSHCSYGMDF